jgi:hypothetical protein
MAPKRRRSSRAPKKKPSYPDDDEPLRACTGAEGSRTYGPADDCDGTCDLWVAHSHPERPLEEGAWLCRCAACFCAIRVAARMQPEVTLTLKTGMDRHVVTLQEAVDALDSDHSLDPLLLHPDDYIREVYVSSRFWWGIRHRVSWPPGNDMTWEQYDEALVRLRDSAVYPNDTSVDIL